MIWLDTLIRRMAMYFLYGRIPDYQYYRPRFSPWVTPAYEHYYQIAAPRTLVSRERCYVLVTLLKQALGLAGDVLECGVYRGGTAAMMATVIAEQKTHRKLYLFDTFAGMPDTDAARDTHKQGDFADTSAEQVEAFVNAPSIAVLRKGFIPDTFAGLEDSRFAFAHIDLDIHKSILDALDFVWPRLTPGGFVVFDDYGFASCPGARQAVDEFFAKTTAFPLVLVTGQAIVFKGTA